VDGQTKKTIGLVTGGCGCLFLLATTAWLCFVIYIGLEGRGNDEEASLIIGAVTCACMVPILILTGVGLYFGLIRKADAPVAAPPPAPPQ
jgi:hypothetical protein